MNQKETLAARLLANRPGLSVQEKETILEELLGPAVPVRTRWISWRFSLAVGTSFVLAGLAIAWWVTSQPRRDEFVARGGAAPGRVSVQCPPLPEGCRIGDRMVFRLNPPAGRSFFAAFAEGTDGRIVWYFPTAESAVSVRVSEHLAAGILDQAVGVGPEHLPGRYTVHALFSENPLDRAGVRAAFRARDVSNDGWVDVALVVEAP